MTFNCKDLKVGDVCIMRNGDEATFIGVNPYADEFKYIFAHKEHAFPEVYSYAENGSFDSDTVNSSLDIIRKKPEKITKWINIYDVGDEFFDTKEEADKGKVVLYRRLACIQVTYEEGEGL